MFLPLSISVSGQQILIVGGGKVALNKVRRLKRFVNNFKVIAPEIAEELKNMEGVVCIERKYSHKDLSDHLLVYAATNNHKLNHQIQADAKRYRCLVNVVDDPGYSDFVSPAIYQMGEMTVAVGSNGKNVDASILLRDKIKAFLQHN
ncbi:precorrin-2 dehydrogenase / sirohydrochlorin ferrochelatase [Saccharicrinis carchari]|uniref:precorrin-2 dehydrogenase n=2 Tax=Saccharicrinis carchari TaxID=1168039 RepID=A0A521EQN7_SACCC|nr:precorrin-2 dehydrogenase / sirohydrochlorin ferrochelatase [Saccharicrinis carchari]